MFCALLFTLLSSHHNALRKSFAFNSKYSDTLQTKKFFVKESMKVNHTLKKKNTFSSASPLNDILFTSKISFHANSICRESESHLTGWPLWWKVEKALSHRYCELQAGMPSWRRLCKASSKEDAKLSPPPSPSRLRGPGLLQEWRPDSVLLLR